MFALTDHLQDAIETGCAKCTETQEKGSYTVIEHLIKNEPEIWNEITAKFDPEGKWRKKYEERAKKNGIEIPANQRKIPIYLIYNALEVYLILFHIIYLCNK